MVGLAALVFFPLDSRCTCLVNGKSDKKQWQMGRFIQFIAAGSFRFYPACSARLDFELGLVCPFQHTFFTALRWSGNADDCSDHCPGGSGSCSVVERHKPTILDSSSLTCCSVSPASLGYF